MTAVVITIIVGAALIATGICLFAVALSSRISREEEQTPFTQAIIDQVKK